MRLIDTKTHLLLEPWKAAGKEYAILSHTWGDQEVIFQEWEQLYPSGAIKGQCPHVRHQGIDKKAGYFKVMKACEQAQRDGFRYLWCDTMCINKESSAELSEAINSMFKWYRDAKVCYVYLSDVTFHNNRFKNIGGPSFCTPNHSNVSGWFKQITARELHSDVHEMKSRFMASRWWTRGWTLQELLAPKKVAFFMQDWGLLGHKSDLSHLISDSTRIHREALEDNTTIGSFSIAQRMSWAADRQTTVVEDMAYCLLGIFDINMPMLYGQGEGAFQKLQHEIIKVSGDQSIFAWTVENDDKIAAIGALARSPGSFRSCGSIIRDSRSMQEPYSLTNVGFKMRVSMIRGDFESQVFIGLNCFLHLNGKFSQETSVPEIRRRVQIWIPVQRRGVDGLYERCHHPRSHVYFQSSYPSTKVVEKREIYLCDAFHRTSYSPANEILGATGVARTGIVIAVGFGHMSMVSKAYRVVWYPERFQVIPVGLRRPHNLSHEVVTSGDWIVILSVAWDEHSKPRMYLHTTLHGSSTRNIAMLVDQLNQKDVTVRYLNDLHGLHERMRSFDNFKSSFGPKTEEPMITVDDEPLHDTHDFTNVMVDIIFKEQPKSTIDRQHAP